MTDITIHAGDNRTTLRELIDQGVRVHSVVTDPPYGLVSVQKRFSKPGSAAARAEGNDGSFARLSGGFMGKAWDGTGIERDPDFWRLIHDILLPGGYVFAFSGSRTGHWQACAMEMAGFIMHPMHGWVFGCLDTDTLAATPDGDKPYTELSAGDDVICYDPIAGEYSVQPILEVVEYDYKDTAFRLIGDHGEQVVSRNHRCIVERDGSEVFRFAEALEQQEVIPVLEDLRGLREALRLQGSESDTKPGVLKNLQGCSALAGPRPGAPSAGSAQGANDHLPGLLGEGLETGRLAAKDNGHAVLQPILPGEGDRTEVARNTLAQRAGRVDGGESAILLGEDARAIQSRVGGRRNAPQQEGQPWPAADQVCALSAPSEQHVSQRRLCDGASDHGSERDGQAAVAVRGGASHQPRHYGQQDHESNAVHDQCGAQTVRAWAGHKSDLVRVVPFHHVGKVWCLRVPTGAFVAVRDGVAFPTGNSGFPKAHNASKAIDKMLGSEGEEEAAQWEGWAYGTQAQKPALEPIYLGQKPFSEKTGAANLLKHGVGAVNIDGCRVSSEGGRRREGEASQDRRYDNKGATNFAAKPGPRGGCPSGRHPANLILDGSPEVVAMFPESKGQLAASKGDGEGRKTANCYGDMGHNAPVMEPHNDSGSAARFFHQFPPDTDPLFYHPKAGKLDRGGSVHPTVKPIALMQYLIRHITPPGGVVLDPFAGSGTTGEAARREGFDCILMEAEPEYVYFLRERFGVVSEMATDEMDIFG